MRCPRQLHQNLLLHLEFVMTSVCKICAGPIEPLDHHLHCVACLGLAHFEAALDESDCGHCADLPGLRTQRSPHSPISFPEDCFRPPSNIEGFVSFGHEAMSILASEKEDWGRIRARAVEQLRAFRPPGGAHEGSV